MIDRLEKDLIFYSDKTSKNELLKKINEIIEVVNSLEVKLEFDEDDHKVVRYLKGISKAKSLGTIKESK